MYHDVMVDIETTGTSPDENAIIQIAAVKFDLKTKQIDVTSMFDKALLLAPKRFWDEDTREWWSKQDPTVYQGIISRAEDPAVVMAAFGDWARANQTEPLRFWAKPTTFDYTFISSYFKQFGLYNPFHFRYAIDLNSFIRGRLNNTDIPDLGVTFDGDAHNALYDVIHQIKLAFVATDL